MTIQAKQTLKMIRVLIKALRISSCIFLVFISSCSTNLTDDAIPYQAFGDMVINLTLPAYSISLGSNGGYKAIDGGVRGIILYRKTASIYLAYERNCSFHPNDACATVDVHSSGLYMFDSCCGSSFNFDGGAPSGGPAWRPLRQYQTSLDGTTLTVTDEIVQ